MLTASVFRKLLRSFLVAILACFALIATAVAVLDILSRRVSYGVLIYRVTKVTSLKYYGYSCALGGQNGEWLLRLESDSYEVNANVPPRLLTREDRVQTRILAQAKPDFGFSWNDCQLTPMERLDTQPFGLKEWHGFAIDFSGPPRHQQLVVKGYEITVPVDAPMGNALIDERNWNAAYVVPSWLLILIFGIPPAARIYAWRRHRRRLARTGHCSHCGYDMRATPNRCPECGEEANGINASHVPPLFQ
jgi:hypothetical protein